MSVMLTAIVFVKADVARIPEIAEEIAALPGVSEVYSVTGAIDLIVLVRVAGHEQVADVVADRLNKVRGRTRDRDAHRVPGLLQPRPGGCFLSRRRVSTSSATTRVPRPLLIVLGVLVVAFVAALVVVISVARPPSYEPSRCRASVASRRDSRG